MKRSAGILLPISALPSPYGIGTLGQSARDFIDFLAEAGQTVWQVLPIGPTSYGDSPYQSFSTFAGNPYFIDLEALRDEGLLMQAELDARFWGADPTHVDYAAVFAARFDVLRLAFDRASAKPDPAFLAFRAEHSYWLEDYALYMALKTHFKLVPWTEWDEPIRLRTPEALAHYRELLADDIAFYAWLQYRFYDQWAAMRAYANAHGVSVIGDLPIYVAMDSADVWAFPQFFQLDETNVPTAVAGVPPDYFSETGQLWGNPLYDWDAMQRDGYGWWIRRIDSALHFFDYTRIDHFRGIASYWSIPADAETAVDGAWVPGPGLPFISMLKNWFGSLPIIAEDLGILTEDVRTLLRDSGLPGMKVLQFAFTPEADSNYLPHNCCENSICYTGTHDNTTLADWADSCTEEEAEFACRYLNLPDRTALTEGLLRAGMGTVCTLFVAQLQDWLSLGAEARMNVPGTLGLNWTWRCSLTQLTPALAERILAFTRLYGRGGTAPAEEAE